MSLMWKRDMNIRDWANDTVSDRLMKGQLCVCLWHVGGYDKLLEMHEKVFRYESLPGEGHHKQ